MSFFKNYFIGERNIGIFQSIMLIIFFLSFSFILFFIFSKPKKYYDNNKVMPIDDKENDY